MTELDERTRRAEELLADLRAGRCSRQWTGLEASDAVDLVMHGRVLPCVVPPRHEGFTFGPSPLTGLLPIVQARELALERLRNRGTVAVRMASSMGKTESAGPLTIVPDEPPRWRTSPTPWLDPHAVTTSTVEPGGLRVADVHEMIERELFGLRPSPPPEPLTAARIRAIRDELDPPPPPPPQPNRAQRRAQRRKHR